VVCVSHPSECCESGSTINTYKWCPSQEKCMPEDEICCDWTLQTPIYCSETDSCVAKFEDCCEDFSLKKCFYEDKCVPEDSIEYCFEPDLSKECLENERLCLNDGLCRD
jgi:hypothetical protein